MSNWNADRHTHIWEQFTASVREMATALVAYMEELENLGCSRQEAVYLAAELQKSLMGSFGGGRDKA